MKRGSYYLATILWGSPVSLNLHVGFRFPSTSPALAPYIGVWWCGMPRLVVIITLRWSGFKAGSEWAMVRFVPGACVRECSMLENMQEKHYELCEPKQTCSRIGPSRPPCREPGESRPKDVLAKEAGPAQAEGFGGGLGVGGGVREPTRWRTPKFPSEYLWQAFPARHVAGRAASAKARTFEAEFGGCYALWLRFT